MYKYLTIESIIAIKEYKSYGFSIRKIAKALIIVNQLYIEFVDY